MDFYNKTSVLFLKTTQTTQNNIFVLFALSSFSVMRTRPFALARAYAIINRCPLRPVLRRFAFRLCKNAFFLKKVAEKFGGSGKSAYLCTRFRK